MLYYLCKDYEFLSNIIIPLVSATIGGAITLVGVIITILHANKTRKKDIIESFRPIIRCLNGHDDYDYENCRDVIIEENQNELYANFISGIFSNTDKANFEIEALEIGSKYYKAKYNRYIKKSENFRFQLHTTLTNIPDHIMLILRDDCDKKYKYKLHCKARDEVEIDIIKIEPYK